MTSEQRIKANRANAKTSTGPKTAQGKARAARNARRHGLSLSVLADPDYSAEVQNLAREIAGEGASPEVLESAHRFAEAQIDLVRISQARHGLLSRHLIDLEFRSRKYIKLKPQGGERLAQILSDLAPTLAAMDRYERRALSRRKFAIREFDEARREDQETGA